VTVLFEFAPAKVNLALHVLGRRGDGYHELDSIVVFADVGDTLAFRPARTTTLNIDGPFAGELSAQADNLVLKAVAALRARVSLPEVHITLTKNLPIASGIGGGSADAAATLRGLLRFANLHVPAPQLQAMALSLGADVPVCLQGQPCRMQGVGEKFSILPALPWKAIVLANPMQGCSTSSVFTQLGLAKGQNLGSPLDPQKPESWRNDLTASALKVLPGIADVLQALASEKSLSDVRMSGSGATCFGLAASLAEAQSCALRLSQRFPKWWIKAAPLRA
jgi:4-diphosphocytidyl-2-C-methyl-D-erythritol kinase